MKARIAPAFILLVAACATAPAPAPSAGPESSAPAPAPAASPPGTASENPTEALALEVAVTDQTTSGRVMALRAMVTNPHAETVEGVRVQLVFLAPGEDEMKVLEMQQTEMASTIRPGGSAPLSWDVDSLYLGTGVGRFALAAYPKRLGDRDLPPPDNWKE
jgi:hypothetical protein